MSLPSYGKTIVTFCAIAFALRTVYRYTSWRKKRKQSSKEINEVILFSEASQLVQSKYSSLRSNVPPSADRILYYLNKSRYSLDICMHMLSNRDISFLIQKLHYRGVKVRLISDADTAFINGSETKRLYKKDAIVLRWMKSDYLMHHKFCLVDASANIKDKNITPFVMTGSLNWTSQALSGNWESVVVTSDPMLVKKYKEEFEKLWVKLAPPCVL